MCVQASYARDALCKALYSRLFSWLVLRINDSIQVPAGGNDKRKSMGVLDIYGFELFEVSDPSTLRQTLLLTGPYGSVYRLCSCSNSSVALWLHYFSNSVHVQCLLEVVGL